MFRTRDIYMKMCHQSKLLHAMTEEERLKLQAHLRQMYVDIERVCDKHGLTVMLAYGSLLGAVRHGGFIPWDDDLDLYMPREDYDKFVHMYSDELPNNYIVYSPHGKNGPIYNFCKVVDKNTEFITPGNENAPYYKGVFVDIFPLEYIGNNKITNFLRGIISLGLIYIGGSVSQYEGKSKIYKELMSGCFTSKFNYWFRQAIGFIFSLAKSSTWQNWIDDVCKGLVETDFYHVPTDSNHQWNPIPKSCYLPIKRVKFDDIVVNIPENPLPLLCYLYGEWKKVPTEDNRWAHFIVKIKL